MIVEGPNYEFATETREELIYNKEKLRRMVIGGKLRYLKFRKESKFL